jgi:hypothetical protein
VVVGALELLQGRDLPPDVLARVVGLLSHEESVVVWTALAVLAGRDIPDALLARGVLRLLEASEVDAAVLVRFLHGRLVPDQAALALSGWLAEAPATRWQVAVQLDWPATFAAELAANVRAMAAAAAVDEFAAFEAPVASAAARWLSGATGAGWAVVAAAALAKLQALHPLPLVADDSPQRLPLAADDSPLPTPTRR